MPYATTFHPFLAFKFSLVLLGPPHFDLRGPVASVRVGPPSGYRPTFASCTAEQPEIREQETDRAPQAQHGTLARKVIRSQSHDRGSGRNRGTRKLIGAHIPAAEAREMITEPALAIKYGLTIQDLPATFHPYLTLSKGIKLAAQAFTKDVARLSCCAA